MKKSILLGILILMGFFLVSCDYPEKSFQALDRDNIPREVTRNFNLERGVYAPFVWSSDHEAIVIDGLSAVVVQQTEDVIVNLKATINETSETFQIKVLKIGSDLTYREQAEDVLLELKNLYNEIDGALLELPNEVNGIYIKYYLDLFQDKYGFYENNNKTYISSSFGANDDNVSIPLTFYSSESMSNESQIWDSYLPLKALKLENDNEYIHAIQAMNTKQYKFNQNRMYISGVSVGDIIEFGEKEGVTYELRFNNPEYFEEITYNQYKVIKPFRENINELLRIVVTIDNMPKVVNVIISM